MATTLDDFAVIGHLKCPRKTLQFQILPIDLNKRKEWSIRLLCVLISTLIIAKSLSIFILQFQYKIHLDP